MKIFHLIYSIALVKILFVVFCCAHAVLEFVSPLNLSKQKQHQTLKISCNRQKQQRTKTLLVVIIVNEHAGNSDTMQLFVKGMDQPMVTDSKIFNICCDVLHDCQICTICLKSRQGRVFFYQQTSARQNNKNKELKKGKHLHCCNATVIKEIDTKHTPAVTDGGSPRKEERGQHGAGRRE